MNTKKSFAFLLCTKLISAAIISNGVTNNLPSFHVGNNYQSANFRSPFAQNGLGLENNLASNNAKRFSGLGSDIGLAQNRLNNVGLAQNGPNNVGLAQNGLNNNAGLEYSSVNNVGLAQSRLNNAGLTQTGLNSLGWTQNNWQLSNNNAAILSANNIIGSQNNLGISQNKLATINTVLANNEQNSQCNLDLAQNIVNEMNTPNNLALAEHAALIDNSGIQASTNGFAQNIATNSAWHKIGNDATSLANFGRNVFNSPLVVASRTPNFPGLGLRLVSDALEVSGLLAVSGKMPLSGAVELNGNLPTEGTVTVNYSCGDAESN